MSDAPYPLPAPVPVALNRLHRARLMQLWRSAGWPSRDAIELDLLAAGLVAPHRDAQGRETLHLTELGIASLALARQRNRRAASAHDRLAERMATMLHAGGRIVWRELSLRSVADALPVDPSPLPTTAERAPAGQASSELPAWDGLQAPSPAARTPWRMARPDLFSVRHTTVEAYLHPVVHEIKASRADLLSDLRHAAKRQAYQWLCCECHYVFPVGVAQPEEVPEGFGVWLVHGDIDTGRIELARPARHVSCHLPFAAWMALAKATPWRPDEDEGAPQSGLGAAGTSTSDPG